MREIALAAAVGTLLIGLAALDAGPDHEGVATADPLCNAECPAGTRRSSFASTEVTERLSDGTFVYFSAGCEATCAPIVECHPPNIPNVTEAGFECRGAPGLSDFERDVEVDLSFVERWDEAAVQVPEAAE